MDRVALIVNRDSGSAPDADRVAAAVERHGAEVELFGLDRAHEVAVFRPDRIAVAGGDGSIAPAARAAATAGAPLAVIPAGTANDFARALELPDDEEEACRLAATGERLRSLDLAHMDDRPFVNAANAGLAVRAAREARQLKRVLGQLAYAAGALRAGLSASPLRCTVRCDGEEVFAGAAWQVIVANTGAFGAGSGIDDADPGDGELDVAIVESGPRARLVQHAYGLRTGRIGQQAGVHHRRAREAEVAVEGEAAFNVDGELCQASARASFGTEPRAFEVVVG
ncbi:MAG: diacylglycerol/lipid kinase family protein [Solirubrobacteraceae bacterium]